MSLKKLAIGAGVLGTLYVVNWVCRNNIVDTSTEVFHEVGHISTSGDITFMRFYTVGKRRWLGRVEIPYTAKTYYQMGKRYIAVYDDNSNLVDLPHCVVENIRREFCYNGRISAEDTGVGIYEICPA